MRLIIFLFISAILFAGCNQNATSSANEANKDLAALAEKYYTERMQLIPLEASYNSDNRFNDLLSIDFTESNFKVLRHFFSETLKSLDKFNRAELNENDGITYDILKTEMETGLEGVSKRYILTSFYVIDGRAPFNQFWGLPLTLGQLGSGESFQPFKTVQDYDNWVKRATAFGPWADSAIIYFRKSISENTVMQEKLVLKMIPQMEEMLVEDATKSLFYGPINNLPDSFSAEDKSRLTKTYTTLIKETIIPAYKKLGEFLKTEYLPKSRKSTGISTINGGVELYNYLARCWTTTTESPDEIYNTGLSEVKRIEVLMDSVKNTVHFTGTLKEFFQFMKIDNQFTPYKKPADVLNAFHLMQAKIEPHLKTMFGNTPKTKFEIRQTEAFRAASASAEYMPGASDGSRPGIFYIPILDATKFNITSGMESLFLHEAIPGHHYQGSLQAEDTSLPAFRRFLWYGAYGEGWALYSESLGKELGLYTDPYQFMGALGDEMHRAIRLVVDVGMHTKNMSREEAIKYMMDHEAISEEAAVAEIERYMAIPGQALSYKVGAMKIRELRNKYANELGPKFNLASYHDAILKPGCMPLDVTEKYMDAWAKKQ